MKAKLVCFILLAAVVSVIAMPIYADAPVEAKYDFENEQLVFYGNTGVGNEDIGIYVVNKDTGVPVLATQKKTEADGSYRFPVSFDHLTKGDYEVTVGGNNLEQAEKTQIFFNQEQIPAVTPAPTPVPERPSGGGGGAKSGGVSFQIDKEAIPTPSPLPSAPPVSISFKDVAEGNWAHASIVALAEKGILTGVGDGMFAPEVNVTREQFAKMLINAFKLKIVEDDIEYTDVEVGEWYYPYLVSAYKYGIMNGYNQDEMGVGKNITRQDLAVTVARALDVKSIVLKTQEKDGFVDENEIADYAKESVALLYEADIFSGMENNQFEPKFSVTRAMAAVVIDRLLNLR